MLGQEFLIDINMNAYSCRIGDDLRRLVTSVVLDVYSRYDLECLSNQLAMKRHRILE